MWGAAEDPEKAALVEKVKNVQRSSQSLKEQWWAFCETTSEKANFDPNRHESAFLQQFLSIVEASGHTVPDHTGSSDNSWEKAALVEKVKNLQRSDSNLKEQWWAFCKTASSGERVVFDPNRHEAWFLQQFLSMVDNGEIQSVPVPASAVEQGSKKEQLVRRVKETQKSGSQYKEAWHAYCEQNGTTHFDPARHEERFLEEFLSTFEAGSLGGGGGGMSSMKGMSKGKMKGKMMQMAMQMMDWASWGSCKSGDETGKDGGWSRNSWSEEGAKGGWGPY